MASLSGSTLCVSGSCCFKKEMRPQPETKDRSKKRMMVGKPPKPQEVDVLDHYNAELRRCADELAKFKAGETLSP